MEHLPSLVEKNVGKHLPAPKRWFISTISGFEQDCIVMDLKMQLI
jgi:hypothetical protein